MVRREPPIGTLSLVACFNHFKPCPINVTSFRLSNSLYSQSCLFKHTRNFGSIFPNLLSRRIYETNVQETAATFFTFSICRNNLKFPATPKIFLSFLTVLLFSCYLSPVNCSNRKVEGTFKQEVNYH